MFSLLIFMLHTPAVTGAADHLKLEQIRKKIRLLSKLDNNSSHMLLLKAKQNTQRLFMFTLKILFALLKTDENYTL